MKILPVIIVLTVVVSCSLPQQALTEAGEKGPELLWKFKCDDIVMNSLCMGGGLLFLTSMDGNLTPWIFEEGNKSGRPN